jgi:hypothetical protein
MAATPVTAAPPLLRTALVLKEPIVSNKNKGGREVRKPKAPQNVKATGQTPSPTAADTINHKGQTKH